MKKVLFLLVVLTLIIVGGEGSRMEPIHASPTDIHLFWQEFGISPTIYNIAVGHTYAWGAHTEGAIRWHKQDHTYRVFTEADGLLDKNVTAVVVDNQDNVWFGTPVGLSKYDGTAWSHYTTDNGLTHNYVTSLSLGPQGELLVGTGGISIFNGVIWQQYYSSPTTDPYNCLNRRTDDVAIGPDGRIWVAGAGYPLCYFNGTVWRIFSVNGISVSASAIEFHANGDLWVVSDQAVVNRYTASGEEIVYTPADGILDASANSIAIDRNGGVWVGATSWSGNSGVNYFDGFTWHTYTGRNGLYSGVVYDIAVDSAGDIWTGSENVSRFHGGKWQTYLAGLPRRGLFLSALFVDSSDNVWVGVSRQGVVKFDGQAWWQYTSADGLGGDLVYAIGQDKNDHMWFASYRDEFDIIGAGLTKYDGNSWERFTTADGLPSDSITDIMVDDSGVLWAAHRDAGVSKRSGAGWINYNTAHGILSNNVSSILAQGDSIWTGHASAMGISRFDGDTWQTFGSDDGLDGNILDLALGQTGQLVTTGSAGLQQYDGMTWSDLPSPPDIGSTDVIAVDQANQIWLVGYSDAAVYNGAQWTLVSTINPELATLQYHMAINERGSIIWFESSMGITRLNLINVTDQLFLPLVTR